MILKRLSILCVMLLLSGLRISSEPQAGVVITITAGTAQRFVSIPTRANSIFIQGVTGGSGRGYVLNANPANTCSKGGAGTTWVADLAPATSTAPGQAFYFPSNDSATTATSGFNIQYWCLDGSNSGDQFLVSWDVRQ